MVELPAVCGSSFSKPEGASSGFVILYPWDYCKIIVKDSIDFQDTLADWQPDVMKYKGWKSSYR